MPDSAEVVDFEQRRLSALPAEAAKLDRLRRDLSRELGSMHTQLRSLLHKPLRITANPRGNGPLEVLYGPPGSNGLLHTATWPKGAQFDCIAKDYDIHIGPGETQVYLIVFHTEGQVWQPQPFSAERAVFMARSEYRLDVRYVKIELVRRARV